MTALGAKDSVVPTARGGVGTSSHLPARWGALGGDGGAVPCHAVPWAASAPPALPSCLLCLCIGTSVYCDDADLEHIPLLPPETTYLYARFNRIGAIRASDFTGLSTLRQGNGARGE